MWWRIVVVMLVACGRVGFESRNDGGGVGGGDGAGPSDGVASRDGTTSGDGGAAAGSGTVSGNVNLCPGFTAVGAAYVMGQAPSGQTSMVLLSTAAPCSMLTTPSWISSLPSSNVTVSLVVGGTTTGSYGIPLCAAPNPGEACGTCYENASEDG